MKDNLMYTLCDMKNINIKYFSKSVHILARSDFIKLKMKFHSFSHEIHEKVQDSPDGTCVRGTAALKADHQNADHQNL